jgi:hypothetical protein
VRLRPGLRRTQSHLIRPKPAGNRNGGHAGKSEEAFTREARREGIATCHLAKNTIEAPAVTPVAIGIEREAFALWVDRYVLPAGLAPTATAAPAAKHGNLSLPLLVTRPGPLARCC